MKISEDIMKQFMEKAYEKAIQGLGGSTGAVELADSYLQKSGSIAEQVDQLILCQCAKCGAVGFASNIGGLLTLPFSLPANVAGTLYIQFQMIAAIAYMGGYDLNSDQVKTLAFVSLCGNGAGKLIQKFGTTATETLVKQVSKTVAAKAVGSSAGKGIPLLSGLIGGIWDSTTTYAIGKAAKSLFIQDAAAQPMKTVDHIDISQQEDVVETK